jgi:hypothetical protein
MREGVNSGVISPRIIITFSRDNVTPSASHATVHATRGSDLGCGGKTTPGTAIESESLGTATGAIRRPVFVSNGAE